MSPREPALSPVNAGCPGICPVVPCREAAMSAGKGKENDTKKERKYTTKAIKPYKIPESNSVKPKLNKNVLLVRY